MANGSRSHERPEKILVAMYQLSEGTTKPLKYEDIVVRAFKLFPDEFALRGYPEYPDSSDIHKPLYGTLKKFGFVRSAHKNFALTVRGVEEGARLAGFAGESLKEVRSGDRLRRDVKGELDRALRSDAFQLFTSERQAKILDTDFYAFLGCTVRTPRNDFLGRLNTVEEALREAVRLAYPSAEGADLLNRAWIFLREQFRPQIERRQGK